MRYLGLAFKNLFRSPKRSLTLGVNYAIVAFVMTALLAFARGAASNVSTSLVRASAGHLTVSGQYAASGRIYGGMLRAPEVASIARRELGEGAQVLPRYLVRSAVYKGGLSKRLSFTGIDASIDRGFEPQMRFSQGSWAAWAADPNGVALTEAQAAYFGIGAGDELVISLRSRFGAFNTGIARVRGVYATDNYFMRDLALAHFAFLRGLDLAPEDAATAIYAYLPRASDAGPARERLEAALAAAGFETSRPASDTEAISAVSAASLRYETDKEGRDRVMLTLSTLDEVLGLVRSVLGAVSAVGALVAAVMLLVIAASIFINLRMSVNERLREIGTMRAIGVESSAVSRLFVLEAALLALSFSLAGSALGALACLAVRLAASFPPGGSLAVFLDAGRLALEPRLGDMAALSAAIAAFAAAFAWLPARRGGRVAPVEALNSAF